MPRLVVVYECGFAQSSVSLQSRMEPNLESPFPLTVANRVPGCSIQSKEREANGHSRQAARYVCRSHRMFTAQRLAAELCRALTGAALWAVTLCGTRVLEACCPHEQPGSLSHLVASLLQRRFDPLIGQLVAPNCQQVLKDGCLQALGTRGRLG